MNITVNNQHSEITLNYNYAAYRELKNVPNSTYNRDNDSWQVDNAYLQSIIEHLQELNVTVGKAMNVVKDIVTQQKEYYVQENVTNIKTVRLKVKENSKSLTIAFDYDPKVLEYIKSIEPQRRRYNPSNKTWTIQKSDASWLYDKLNGLGYVDMSELKKCIPQENTLTVTPDDFPHSTITPYPFQIDVVNQMLKYKKIINSLEAGLGKTIITIMACEKINQKALIICPASVKQNWKKEIKKINPYKKVVVLEGKSEWESANYVILNYNIVGRFLSDIEKENYNVIVFDEAHKLRGINTSRGTPNSQRAKICLELAKGKEYVFPLTATPFINYTKDIFNLLKVIEHPMADNWYAFANTYCGAVKTGYGTNYNGSSNQEKLNERLYPTGMIRLRTEDHIELPERVRTFIPFDINVRSYNSEVKKYLAKRDTFEENGQHLVYLNAMRMKLAMEKAKKAVEMVHDIIETGESVVVFTNYTEVVDYLMDKLGDDAVKITGDIPSKQRQEVVDMFQNGKKLVLVGNIDAAGEGITLTKSNTMIVIDFHWSPVFMVKQMEKRIHRISQTRPVNIMYLYAQNAELDAVMAEMLERKLNDASLILDGESESFIDEVIQKLT